jgi:glycosyltransferase involved in cell wall biosynthesis
LNNTLSLPNKLFDYVQAGLAVVASDLVELARFVHSNAVGLVFSPGNTTGILTTLDALAADPGRLAKMRLASRAAATRFNWENERTKLIDAYERLQRGRGH